MNRKANFITDEEMKDAFNELIDRVEKYNEKNKLYYVGTKEHLAIVGKYLKEVYGDRVELIEQPKACLPNNDDLTGYLIPKQVVTFEPSERIDDYECEKRNYFERLKFLQRVDG